MEDLLYLNYINPLLQEIEEHTRRSELAAAKGNTRRAEGWLRSARETQKRLENYIASQTNGERTYFNYITDRRKGSPKVPIIVHQSLSMNPESPWLTVGL